MAAGVATSWIRSSPTMPGLALGIVATLLSFVVSMIFILSQGGSLALDSIDTWQALLMNVLTIGLWCLIGYGLGLLVRQMIASVVIAVVFSYVLEPILSLIFTVKQWTIAGRLLPSGATDTAIGISPLDLIHGHVPTDGPAAWTGLLVLLGWALLPAVIGYFVTVRRDVDWPYARLRRPGH